MNTEPTKRSDAAPGICLSIGIIAWNEERALPALLQSLFRQTLFGELRRRNLRCEILCLANACTDRTVAVADGIFQEQDASHADADAFVARTIQLRERGKINAWNQFVHSLSARESKFLILMDADIVIRNRDTLFSLWQTLENMADAKIAVDVPHKDIEFKPRKNIRDRMSLAVSKLTRSASAQLCAQLYCIRAETARNIYLPKDLAACDDGFIKTLVCTDFLAHAVWPMRIQVARNASHTFEAYTALPALFKNQKRQAIGQTLVHLLVDEHLKRLPAWERSSMAETLRRKDQDNPDWLKRLVHEHLRRTRFFWRLYPGLLSLRFKRMTNLSWPQRLVSLPAVLAGTVLALVAGFAAHRFLKAGDTGYWPRAERNLPSPLKVSGDSITSLPGLKAR